MSNRNPEVDSWLVNYGTGAGGEDEAERTAIVRDLTRAVVGVLFPAA